MAAHVANQASTGGRRPAITVGNLILASKITAPNVPGWAVERPQLTELIAEGARCCPLTVVTGPPGAGKTMTLASWAATEPGMVAWLCVDEFDNRPGVFLSYAVAAVRRCGVAIPKALLTDPQAADDLVESRACAAVADIQAALAAAERAGGGNSAEAAVTLAHAWASDGDSAQHALAPVLAADSGASDRVRLQAWLVDAWLSYTSGDCARGGRSLAAGLRLAEPEQLRLPFAAERGWLGPVLRRDPELAATHRRLLAPALGHEQIPALVRDPDRAPVLVLEPLSERELEVLVHVSGMLNTAEVASEMYTSVNTVKTRLRNIYRKLAAAHRGEAVRRARQLQLI